MAHPRFPVRLILLVCSVVLLRAGALLAGTERADVTLGKPHRIGNSIALLSAPPANDVCSAATVLTGTSFSTSLSTAGATAAPGETSPCTTVGATVWYAWTSGDQWARVTVDTFGSDFDTALAAYTGGCGSLSAVGCNDDSAEGGDGFQSAVSFLAEPNTTYYIQAGGFDGDSGNLAFHFAADELACAPIEIDGALGANNGGRAWVGASGTQVGRLNRNLLASSCATPKACDVFDLTGGRAYDAYTIPNQSGADRCVTITLTENADQTCNLQSNAYLGGFDPQSICTGYLGDPGLSTGVPPATTTFSAVVPAWQNLIVVVHTTNPGESGCGYRVTVVGDICTDALRLPAVDGPGLALLAAFLAAAGALALRRGA